MPRLKKSLPKYRKHKASGQAIVTLDGKDFYLGPHGTEASHGEYDRLVGEWQANGRRLKATEEPESLSMVEMLNAYRKHADQYYRKNDEPTGAIHGIRAMLKVLWNHYGEIQVTDFGPLALKSIRLVMIESGQSRRYVNDHVGRIKRMFKWAAGNELIPFDVYHRLTAVEGLRKGRTTAKETDPILPVDDATVDATVPYLPQVVADMVRFQRLTGCRPCEARILRPCDVDTSGDVWRYVPESHKTEHHDKQRVIFIGPRGQDVLRPYLLRPSESRCFSPSDSERKRRREVHERRVTPMSCGNKPGSNCKRRSNRTVGDMYTKDSYCRAIRRACDKAFPAPEPLCRREGESLKAWHKRLTSSQLSELKKWQKRHHWAPNQLRHSVGTEIRKRYGLEAAQVTLGHSNANVTQIYAERDMEKAAAIMREVG